MGNKIEVWAYTYFAEFDEYDYVGVYGGRSLIKALIAGFKAKRKGSGCIKIEWR